MSLPKSARRILTRYSSKRSGAPRAAALLLVVSLAACGQSTAEPVDPAKVPPPDGEQPVATLDKPTPDSEKTAARESRAALAEVPKQQEVVLAGGCFWCTEAVFERVKGVDDVVSGYTGGKKETADYRRVASGGTKHAEAIRITYDPEVVNFGKLLQIFFAAAHDPTQRDRQGPDIGKHYRSTIFYATDEQRNIAEKYIKKLNDEKTFDRPIATTLEPLEVFYPAEGYHQNYVDRNPSNPYIRRFALPKVDKLKKAFPEQVKE